MCWGSWEESILISDTCIARSVVLEMVRPSVFHQRVSAGWTGIIPFHLRERDGDCMVRLCADIIAAEENTQIELLRLCGSSGMDFMRDEWVLVGAESNA